MPATKNPVPVPVPAALALLGALGVAAPALAQSPPDAGPAKETPPPDAASPEPPPDDAPNDEPPPDDAPNDEPLADEPPEENPPPQDSPSGAAQKIERPKLLRDAQPRYPKKAWQEQREADVTVLLTLDVQGAVTEAEVLEPAGHGFDEEALRAARLLQFSPARIDGVPTPVKIRYKFRFRVPEKDTLAREPAAADCAECVADEREPATLSVTVFERGKGKRLPGVEVYFVDDDRVILTDEDGRLTLEVAPGAHAFTIRPPGFYPYEATERVEAGEKVELKYYVRRHRRSRYSTIVWGSEGRAEVARTSLVDDEIRSIAGTMGDPIRVAMLLPGVSSSVSGLGYPIVRGSLPGDQRYEIDGIRVPMLYHLLVGPAVIHPRFVDQITFQPGGYSAEHGRFPGGRIAATTARVNDDPLWVADLSIVETSLLRSQKIGERSEMVAAARYGTLGYIVEGISSDVVFRYWDYQARGSHRLPNGGKLTLTVLGASDTAGEKDPDTGDEEVLSIGFHTADLRYRQAFGDLYAQGGVQVSHEFFEPPDEDEGDLTESGADLQSARPYVEVGWTLPKVELKAGGDVLYQDFGLHLLDGEAEDVFDVSADTGVTLGAWTAAEWELGRFLLNPSLRIDHYRYDGDSRDARETAVDPRLSVAFDLTGEVKLKASAGIYSGPVRISFAEPPIVFGPIPAFEGPGLFRGLSRTYQYQAGVETKLPRDLELSATGFYHDAFSPVDFSLVGKELEADPTPCDGDTGGDTTMPFDVEGKSYGAEFLLRRRLGEKFFGWASYAIARSERTIPGEGTIPFDFDQTHVLNATLSWEVGRDWTLGTVFHYNTGSPYTPQIVDQCTGGVYEGRRGEANSARLPNYWRIDFRVQKREVFDTWFFDFYIDFFNAAFQWETVGYDVNETTGELEPEEVPLFIPMIGIRGEF